MIFILNPTRVTGTKININTLKSTRYSVKDPRWTLLVLKTIKFVR